jgi:hypothetical protein
MISFDSTGHEDATRVVPLDGSKPYWERVAWIPAKFGKRGKWVRVDAISGNWQVTEVWSKKPTEIVAARTRDHLNQRKASDI